MKSTALHCSAELYNDRALLSLLDMLNILVLLPAIRLLERRARYLFYCVFLFAFFVNNFSTTSGSIQGTFCMRAYSGSGCVFSPFGGWRPPGEGGEAEKEEMKFLLLCLRTATIAAYPGVRDNRSTINTKTGYDDMGVNGEFLHFGGF